MLRHRRIAAGLAAAFFAAAGLSGCAMTSLTGTRTISPNPLVVPSADFETVWKAAVEVVDDYFAIAQENRLAGKIVTDPKISATLLEPWDGDTVGFRNRLESSLQTIPFP